MQAALMPPATRRVIAAFPFYIAISATATPVFRKRLDEKFQRGAENQAFLVESVTGVETLKSMAVEPQMQRRWEEQLAGYVAASFRVLSLGNVATESVQFINRAVTALLLFFGARLVMDGSLTVGELVAFNMLASRVNTPVLRLAQIWQDFHQTRISVERLGDILNTPPEPQFAPGRAALPQLKGDIAFEHVTFRYRIDGPEILADVSFTIPAGQIVGIVGPSGSGKSTLAKLIQRLYVPESGRVLVDGVDLALADPAWLRRQTAIVLQENILFNRTVRDNIALAEPSAAMSAVIGAASLAGAHEFILQLPEGYDTVIGERGSTLSGGQRQRIAIARALLQNPKILIFDEATSALDYESERVIQANMAGIAKGRTVLIIAHRLSTVRTAERILTLDRGRLVEDGAHDELVKSGGRYATCTASRQISMKPPPSNVIILPPAKRTRAELAFLPAALEITDTPPSPTGRWIVWSVIAVFSLALAWACLGKVDIVATAPGKIIPTGRTKTIQPYETGVVRAIYVRDGQKVAAGDALIDLDPTINAAEQNHLKADLLAAELDIARLKAELASPTEPLSLYVPPREASAAQLAAQRRYLMSQSEERRTKIAAIERQKAQKEAEAATTKASIAKLEATIPLLQQKADVHRALIGQQLVSKLAYLETEEKLIEQQEELKVQRAHLKEAEAAIAATLETRNHTASEFERTLSGDLSEAERKAAGLREDIVKAEEKAKLQRLVAPVTGTVQQLAVHTIGGIVTPAQPLLVVVPADSELEIEAMISNRDIGFVREGQDAQIKVDTFPFTRYGLLPGRVLHVSGDVIAPDPQKEKPSNPQDKDAPKPQDLAFAARVSLGATAMQIDERLVSLTPGMAVTVEVKTGRRRIITYLLSPLMRYSHESIRER
jgi:HlyD family type I secretion membrane fusion protein